MTQQVPTQQSQPKPEDMLVANLCGRLRASLSDNGPTAEKVLEWLQEQDVATVRAAILRTQPRGWAIACQPLVDTLTDEQAKGILAALIAVFVQTIPQ